MSLVYLENNIENPKFQMIVVYGTPYYTQMSATIVQPLNIAQNIGGAAIKIPLKLIIANPQTSIRSFIENDYVDCKKPKYGRVYIQSPTVLSLPQLEVINEKLKSLDSDLKIPKLTLRNNYVNFQILETLPNISSTLKSYDNIHLHYAFYSDGDEYTFINLSSKKNMIEVNEDVVNYVKFADRNLSYSSIHGHVNVDGTVDIFNYVPVSFEYKIYVLDPKVSQLITPNIAMLVFDGSIIMYLITRNSFSAPNYTKSYAFNGDITELSPAQIQRIFQIIYNYGFTNVSINENCIYAYDADNFMFMGTVTDKILGTFAKYFSNID